MKRIYIVRHGKSDWENLELNDIERPLKSRGEENSHEMSVHMKELGWIPDLILSSPAVRAFETARIFADNLGVNGAGFKVDEKLYLPDFSVLLRTLLYLSDDIGSVMIVGHEPSLTYLINHFLTKPMDRVVTASMTMIDLKIDEWKDLSPDAFSSGIHKNRHDMDGVALH